MNNRSSLERIAKKMGVSKVTVSVALRNKPGVSEYKRERIKQTARQMGYQINPIVSSLMGQIQKGRLKNQAPTVALVVLRSRSWKFLNEVSEGVRSQTELLGYRLREFFMGEEGMTPERAGRILRSERIEGLILGDGPRSQIRLPSDLVGFVTVMLGFSVVKPETDRVWESVPKNIRTAVRGLKSLGYRRIGLFLNHRGKFDRSDGLLGAVFNHEMQSLIPEDQKIPFGVSQEINDEGKAFKAWFAKHRPDAILSYHDGILTWLREMGLRVPEDVGIASLSLLPGQNWAGIDQNFKLIAQTAMTLLDSRFRTHQVSIPSYPLTVFVPGFWKAGITASRR